MGMANNRKRTLCGCSVRRLAPYFSWGFLLLFVLFSVPILRTLAQTQNYKTCHPMRDRGFWRRAHSFAATSQMRVIPAQLPGPLDLWAGGQPSAIRLPTGRHHKDASLRVTVSNSHDLYPPLLECALNGRVLSLVQVEAAAARRSHA